MDLVILCTFPKACAATHCMNWCALTELWRQNKLDKFSTAFQITISCHFER